MTNHERKTLIAAYTDYISGKYHEISSFIIVMVGFCLATLSAQKISPTINFTLIALILVVFICIMIFETITTQSELKKVMIRLKDKYKSDEKSLSEIKSYDIWFGFNWRIFRQIAPSLFAIIFTGYTLFEHGARAFNWW